MMPIHPRHKAVFSSRVPTARPLEPASSGFSVLNLDRRYRSPSQLVAISKVLGRSSGMLPPIASCCATWVTISVTDA